MAVVPIFVFTSDLVRIALRGLSGSTQIVNVFHYVVDTPLSFAPNVTSLDDVALEFHNSVAVLITGELHDSYMGQDITVAVYKTPFKVEIGTTGRFRMNTFSTHVRPFAVAGLRAGAKLPDFAVYRPFKITGRAGRSWRGSSMFSPLLEADTDGNSWTAAFLNPAGPGGTLRTAMATKLFGGDASKRLKPILFRVTEYLKPPPAGPAPTSGFPDPTFAPDFDALDRTTSAGILRRRKVRTGT